MVPGHYQPHHIILAILRRAVPQPIMESVFPGLGVMPFVAAMIGMSQMQEFVQILQKLVPWLTRRIKN